jgi:hypothetical protein
MKNKFLKLSTSALFFLTIFAANGQSWSLTGNAGTNPATNYIGTRDNQPLIFRTNKLERMRITKSGNIGIATSTPQALLSVDASTSSALVNTQAIFTHAQYGVGVEGFSNNGSGIYGISTNYIGVYGYTGSTDWYAGYFAGNVYCSGTYSGSDQNLKQNIHDFSGAIDILLRLHPEQYQFRQDGNYALMNLPRGNHYGLIAQDVEKVLPNLVKDSKFETRYAKPDGVNEDQKTETLSFKALNYTELIPIIIKGIQEQQQVIEDLQNVNKKQQQQIDELLQMLQTSSVNQPSSKFIADNGRVYLQQNAPNPFSANTIIRCYLTSFVKQPLLIIYSINGKLLKSYSLGNSGLNEVTIAAGTLSSGEYIYSLLIDRKKVGSKHMMLTR